MQKLRTQNKFVRFLLKGSMSVLMNLSPLDNSLSGEYGGGGTSKAGPHVPYYINVASIFKNKC